LDSELVIFKNSHQENIDEAYERGSRAYNVATLSLTESVSFVEGFVKFVDAYMKHLTQAKFGTKKAFHITTRLGIRMWSAIAEPRNGVIKMFKAGDVDQIGSSIFWASIRSLDLGMSIKRNGFKDDPLVSSELIKFLAVNTGIESIECLENKVAALQCDLAETKRSAVAASKAATSGANKIDELKSALAVLAKRFDKT
jgi:hypothetical protein